MVYRDFDVGLGWLVGLLALGVSVPGPASAQAVLGFRAEANRQMQAYAALTASIRTSPSGQPMSCATVRAISAPIGAALGAAAGLLLHLVLGGVGDGPEAAHDEAFTNGVSDRMTFGLVGAGLGAMWGIIAPPTARRCWITLRRPPDDGRGPEGGLPRLPGASARASAPAG